MGELRGILRFSPITHKGEFEMLCLGNSPYRFLGFLPLGQISNEDFKKYNVLGL